MVKERRTYDLEEEQQNDIEANEILESRGIDGLRPYAVLGNMCKCRTCLYCCAFIKFRTWETVHGIGSARDTLRPSNMSYRNGKWNRDYVLTMRKEI